MPRLNKGTASSAHAKTHIKAPQIRIDTYKCQFWSLRGGGQTDAYSELHSRERIGRVRCEPDAELSFATRSVFHVDDRAKAPVSPHL